MEGLLFLSITKRLKKDFLFAAQMIKYVSFDIEASGPCPGIYSMLSLGATIVGDTDKQFYREIKPLNNNFTYEGMRFAIKGLRCLDEVDDPRADIESSQYDPLFILDVLRQKGDDPKEVMKDYAFWVMEHAGDAVFEVASPIKFDSMFTTWYFHTFCPQYIPFSLTGEDIGSLYKGAVHDMDASLSDLDLGIAPHNALEDAILRAKQMEAVLNLLYQKG